MRIQRTLPPAAAPLSVHDLLHGLAGIFLGKKQLMKLKLEIQEYFGVKHVFFVSSGKAALTIILVALKSLSSRQRVVIPAYTCFSVPSAIVKAGLNVSLCDLDPQSLDFNFDRLQLLIDGNPLCVIPTHLLGLHADVDRVKGLCQDKGVFVVEDVAQAMGVKHNGQFLGTRGDVAFFSLGRGKNITCGSGGIIITNSDSIAQVIRGEYIKLTKETLLRVLKNFCQVLGMNLMVTPRMYWLPAGLPFLKLGETKFYHDFPIHQMDGVRAGLLSDWRERLERSNKARCLRAEELIRRLTSVGEVAKLLSSQDPCYLRLPLLMQNKQAKERLCDLSKQHGLGVSPLYPTTIREISELQGKLPDNEFPAATLVADRLVTLPIHSLVTPHDVETICTFMERVQDADRADQFCSTASDLSKDHLSAET